MNVFEPRSFFLLLPLLLLLGCEAGQSISGKFVTYEVESNVIKPEPQYVVWNVNDEVTELHWRIPKNSLLPKLNDADVKSYNFRFRYRIYQNYSSRTPLDSGVVVVTDLPVSEIDGDYLSGEIDLKLASGLNYLVQVSLFDLGRNVEDVSLVDVQKAYPNSPHYFRILNPEEEYVYKNYTSVPGRHSVLYSKALDTLWVKYYSREFPMANAPFTTVNPKPFDFTPDSLYSLVINDDGTFDLDVFNRGFYQLAIDPKKQDGTTVYYHSQYYPAQRTVMDLIMPMRYISTNQEFEAMQQGDNLKRNVDEFWLGIGGSPDRARKIIKSYYNRVEYANEHFGSYMEGWKTDRGMCFTVFGQPDAVYRTTSAEKWVYGTQSNRVSSLTLVFTKVMNPFTNNDFRLNRSSALKTPWYRAVEFWRQGRVVNYR